MLISVDGMLPATYLEPDDHGLKVPTLRRFVAEGGYSEGTRSVFPTATYPAHSSIATGVLPHRHGIYTNRAFDPWERSFEAWNWYAEDLRAKPIWEAARERGLSVALVNWPVTVGANVEHLVPEFWRAKIPDDLKLTRALSTPGLMAAAERRFPGLSERFVPPQIRDEGGTDVAVYVLGASQPQLLLLHIFEVDGAQHKHGLWSPQAIAAIENADAQIGRVLAELARTDKLATSAVVVVSDHGFRGVARQLHPGALLKAEGLVTLDANGRVTDYQAYALSNGGMAYVYLRDGASAEVRERVQKLFASRAGVTGSGIARVFDSEGIAKLGGDERALLALEAEPGAYFGGGYRELETPPANVATHGYAPEHPDMQASLLWLGPGLRRGVLPGTQLIDVAPTIAAWLGLTLPDVEGRVLR